MSTTFLTEPTHQARADVSARRNNERALFAAEFFTSCGVNFLQVGIFFYTARLFHWSLGSNFALAAGQGTIYVIGALLAQRIAGRFDKRRALAGDYALMALASMCVAIHPTPQTLAVGLLAYAGLSAIAWPMLESLVSEGIVSEALSRRIMIYNLVWSGSAALVLAINGAVIEHWSRGVFVIPAFLHGGCALLIFRSVRRKPSAAHSLSSAHAHLKPEPQLLHMRTLALWLSRVSLPAAYVVLNSLMALMPSLPIMRTLSPAQQSLTSSTWLTTRLVAFAFIGLSTWWHTRPRVLLAAAALMLLSFVAIVVRPSDLFHSAAAFDLPTMLIAQGVLGVTLGMIYNASLYFGMALSDGSTEHGGYHEALIGLGSVIGPGIGALTQWFCPGSTRAGIIAVCVVVAASVVATFLTPLFIRRSD